MAKKTLEEKIKDIVFYATVFFILYLIIGFLIKSEWLTSFTKSWVYAYELLRDALTLTAYFLAPVAAFVLFSNWREQHNKQIANEFALKVFNQFEALEQAIQKASFILIELENLMPIESRNGFDPGYRPLRIDDEIFLNNSDLILSFPLKLQSVDEEFNLLVDKMRYFGIVVNQLEHVGVIIKITMREFKKIYEDDFNESYSEYLQLIEHYSDRLKKYEQLRGTISELIIHDILDQLKAR